MFKFLELQARFRFYGKKSTYFFAFFHTLKGSLYKGNDVALLEKEVSHFIKVKHAIAMSQGRVAIYHAVKSIIKPGQEVILSPYTIYDVVNMVLAAGGTPIFADIESKSANIDPKEIRKLINSNTGAVLVTHLHGLSADMNHIKSICKQKKIPIIEDAAQAFGAKYNDNFLGSIGDIGIFSFGRVKNINGLYGGMLVTNKNTYAKKIRNELKNFNKESRLKILKRIISNLISDIAISKPFFNFFSFWVFRYGCLNNNHNINKLVQTEDGASRCNQLPESYRTLMTPLQARIIFPQLKNVLRDNMIRISNAQKYFSLLKSQNNLILPPELYDESHIYLVFPVQVKNRWSAVKYLMKNNSDLVIQHYKNAADLKCFKEFYRNCPIARSVANKMILLPCYPGYSPKNIKKISNNLNNFLHL
ncbi:WecE Predicted pyridoxal phosphate-dependent enzyme apparently involved in regulation of cell wall biogenesis [Candidatus Methylopumilus universalis]|uniref:DegT/DnrJ/EryC1/StrS family aminotransferase n=1 Tax=Candidatus Methylopumilus universalis TaxID=2588536 RepID=UPI003BEF2D25